MTATFKARFTLHKLRLKLVDQHESGFLTALVGSDPAAYLTANFRIIKAVTTPSIAKVPVITRPAGHYLVATATNSQASVQRALASIQRLVAQQQLQIADQYWQFNLSEQLTSKAGSAKIAIEYQTILYLCWPILISLLHRRNGRCF